MTARTHIALFLVVLLSAWGAGAKVYIEFRPRMSMMGGYDDNITLKGNGGDAFGQAAPGLKLDLFGEHDLHLDLDCQAGLARLAHPEEFGLSSGAFAANESCVLGTKVHLSPRDKLLVHSVATYAQDPFSIAGLGLLLRPGQTQIFVGKLSAEIDHALSGHTEIDYGVDTQALAFGAGDPGNGYVIAPSVKYAWNSSARSKWDVGVREQLFFGVGAPANTLAPKGVPGGLLDEAHSAMLGYTWALTPYADVFGRAGGVLVTGGGRDMAMPVAKFGLESYTPSTAVSITAGHDLVIGPSSAGPIVGDIAELGVIQQWEKLGGHFRIGIYRNVNAFNASQLGTVGWGGEVGLDWSFTRNLKLGVAAMRDARLYDPAIAAPLVDRDVVQLRLTWEKARFE
ncbi:MAG: hypothetical protein ABR567_06960 [Myxococcales bacterium]|nr:hypothetical protein [Myxococcales bacterium]